MLILECCINFLGIQFPRNWFFFLDFDLGIASFVPVLNDYLNVRLPGNCVTKLYHDYSIVFLGIEFPGIEFLGIVVLATCSISATAFQFVFICMTATNFNCLLFLRFRKKLLKDGKFGQWNKEEQWKYRFYCRQWIEFRIRLDENGDSSSKLYNPQVSDEIKPKKGQEFETLDDVLKFYNSYAKAAGFSVRSVTEKKRAGRWWDKKEGVYLLERRKT